MGSKRGLNALIVQGVVEGLSRAETADRAGVSERTLRRRLQDPDVLKSLADVRAELHGEVLGRLQQLAFKAVEQIDEVLESGTDASRIAVSKLVLDQLIAQKRASEDARLAVLEIAHAEVVAQAGERQS